MRKRGLRAAVHRDVVLEAGLESVGGGLLLGRQRDDGAWDLADLRRRDGEGGKNGRCERERGDDRVAYGFHGALIVVAPGESRERETPGACKSRQQPSDRAARNSERSSPS